MNSSGLLSKSIFRGEFPLVAEFRSGPRNAKPRYDLWKESQRKPEGFYVDLQTNVLRFAPENYRFANEFAAENPDMLMLSTWRAASGQPKGATTDGDPLGISTIDFAGHWVYSPGTTLASDLSENSETIRVESSDNMLKGPALLVETRRNGEKLWNKFEYVLIKKVDGKNLTVRRSYNGSPPSREFPADLTYVAPIPWDGRNREPYTDWFFNLSEFCPTDDAGRTAMDVLFEDMVEPLSRGGELENLGGLDLASGPLTVTPDNADYDVDGTLDLGSVYREGVATFYKRLRRKLRPEQILITSLDYEFLGYINGVNQEGLANPNDPWKDVSQTVNNVLAWKALSTLPWASIAFVQNLNKEEDELYIQMHRLLNGYSSCLGLAADVEIGDGYEGVDALTRAELFKGDEKEKHWLGKPLGMKRTAALTPNILGDASGGTDWEAMMPAMDSLRATLAVDDGELVLSPTGEGSGYMTLTLTFRLRRKSDVTVFFDALSDDEQLERKILLPRVSVPVDVPPARAFLTSLDYLNVSFHARGAEGGGRS